MNRTIPNLLPPSAAARCRAAAAARIWVRGLAALSCAAGTLIAVATAAPAPAEDAGAPARLNAAADADFALADAARKEAADAARRLDLRRAVSGHPDWSLLLGVIAEVRGEHAVIESVEVRRKAAPPARPASSRGTPEGSAEPALPREAYLVKVAGVVSGPGEATALVLRLEQTGIFERVALLQTQPRELAGRPRTAFALECDLAAARPAASAPADRSAP